MKKVLAIFTLMLVGCGDSSRAQMDAVFSTAGVSSICYQGVTYLITSKGGIAAQFTPDGHVVPCTK